MIQSEIDELSQVKCSLVDTVLKKHFLLIKAGQYRFILL